MIVDYILRVLTKYEKLKFENKLPLALINPTPARIKNECLLICQSRYRQDDERILREFFGPIDGQYSCVRAIKRCDVDRFRPLANYLKSTITNTDPKNIELLAWLIDFEDRPFSPNKSYKKQGPDGEVLKYSVGAEKSAIRKTYETADNSEDAHPSTNPPSFYEDKAVFLSGIRSGRDEADIFHRHSLECLTEILGNRLSNPKSEVKINEGRKRIDIVFDNYDTKGFFHTLNQFHHIKCPKIFIECKNYGKEIGNPEIDQLLGRLGNKRGNFGMLLCRSVSDRSLMIKRCRDVLNDNSAYIIVLDDDDIKHLLELKGRREEDLIDRFLSSKIDELIM